MNQVKYTSPIGTKMVFDVTYSRFRADDAFGSRPEVKPGDIATNDTTTQTTEVALPTYDANDMHRDQVRTSMSFFKGTHDVKVGYEYVNGARISRVWSTSGMRANFANGVPTSVNTYLVQVTNSDTTYGADIDELYRNRADDHGFFIQDRWTPMRKLALNLGLRYETNSSFQPATCRPTTQLFPGACFDKITAPSFRDLSPRFNFVYDLTGNGRTALKFAANRYNQPINISIINRLNPVATVSDQRTWTDSNNDKIPQVNELGPAPGYVFAGRQLAIRRRSEAADLERVHRRDPASASDEHRVVDGLHAQTDPPEHRPDQHGGRPRVVGRADHGEGSDQRRDRQVWRRGTAASANLFYNSDELDTNYHGGDITLNKRMSNRWSLMGGASWGKVTAKTRGGNRNDPHILNYFDADRARGRRSSVVVPDVGHLRASVRRFGERHLAVPGRRAGRDDRAW